MILHGTTSAGQTPEKSPAKFNVVFFLVDDLGWSDVGFQGSTAYHTPNIDAFARRGLRFSQAYAACPVCSPTRASILTGQYPARLHLTDWLPGRKDYPFQKLKNCETLQQLPDGTPTLAKMFRGNGFRTGIFGKWHLGEEPDSTRRNGFDIHVPDWNKGWPNTTYFSPYGMKGLEGGAKGEYLTDRLTAEALKWVEENRDKPFFLYLSHFAVHDPVQGRPDLVAEYETQFKRTSYEGLPYILEGNPDDPNPLSREVLKELLSDKRYRGFSLLPNRTVKIKQRQDNPEFAAMVQSMDQSLGRVLAKLKELNLDDKTIVVFFSDNGGMSAANLGNPARRIPPRNLNLAYSTSNLPWRGGKGWLYEGGIREPLIIYVPDGARNGGVTDAPVMSTDFYATFSELLGFPAAPQAPGGVDGVSLASLLRGDKRAEERLADRALYWHWPHYSNHGAQSPGGAIRLGDYKLIEYYENNTVQLFNLRSDPGETRDVALSRPEKTAELLAKLHAWRRSVNAAMPMPNPAYDSKQKWPEGPVEDEP